MPSERVATRPASASAICGLGVCASSNCPNVSSSFLRTRSSGVCASAAIIGPTNSSASRIARASSGVRRGGEAERVAVQLLVDVHAVALERGIHRVAAAAEVDEVQQLEVLFELLRRECGSARRSRRRDDGVGRLAAGREQVGEQRLQNGEAFGHDRTGGRSPETSTCGTGAGAASLGGTVSCRSRTARSASATSRRSSVGLDWDRAAVLAQHPGRELRQRSEYR